MDLHCTLRGVALPRGILGAIMSFCVLLTVSPSVPQDLPGTRWSQASGWNESWPAAHVFRIAQDSDDGTETDGVWYPGGVGGGLDYLGRDTDNSFTVGLRFAVPDLEQGQVIKYARLRLAAQGGELASGAHLLIEGIAEDSPEPLSNERRPSVLAKTAASVNWNIGNPWLSPPTQPGLRYSSPNLAGILNEILSRPAWSEGAEGKVLIITIDGICCPEGEANYLAFEDYTTDPLLRDEAFLEVYPSLADAFVGKPTLGRPTDTSVTVNVVNLLGLDIYAEYGVSPGAYPYSTAPLLSQAASQPVDIVIDGLDADTDYCYRIRYRQTGDSTYLEGMEGRFHTQRQYGSGFTFTIQADSHLWPLLQFGDADGVDLYRRAIQNIGLDQPDFHISLGDFAQVECHSHRDVLNLEEAVDRYLEQRDCLDPVLHSIPFYLAIGNHEGEQGWRVVDPTDSVAQWGTLARKQTVLNPVPDDFYSGDNLPTTCCGLREDYYSWEWGDALFVVLDPFWYTTTKPHCRGPGEGSEDAWDWTLGQEQYNWLRGILQGSGARWKFVFIHHLVGGVYSPAGIFTTPYGHGGIEAAKYRVDSRGSYEWGGEDKWGSYEFEIMRPGWAHGPIHDLLLYGGVTAVFHGHDHVFVHQVLDGMVYQTCPQPSDASYGDGCYDASCYCLGEKRNNSGHVRVAVAPDYVQVDYVRAVLPEDEPLLEGGSPIYNGQVSYSYSLGTASVKNDGGEPVRSQLLGNRPNPFRSQTSIMLYLPGEQDASLKIYDIEGRLVASLFEGTLTAGSHEIPWKGHTADMGPAASGVYICELEVGGAVTTRKMLLLR